jgi:hypothetical protein
MSAPKRIFAHVDWKSKNNRGGIWKEFRDSDDYGQPMPIYIRADLVDRLKGYAVHDDNCESMVWRGIAEKLPCTCGLTEFLKGME